MTSIQQSNNYFNKRITCPICFNNKVELLHSHRFAHVNEASICEAYDVVSCNQCGMIFANNIPSQSEFDQYYASFSKYEMEEPLSLSNEYCNAIIEIICGFTSQNHKIIDIGCGYGYILRTLCRRGYKKLTGVESSEKNIYNLSQSGEIRGICDTLFNLNIESAGGYDCIIMSYVLEHIVDLAGTMKILSDLLTDGGIVVVAVPDSEHFLIGAASAPYQEFSVEHINYFSEQSLTALFAQYGMSSEKILSFRGHLIAVFKKDFHVKKQVIKYIRLCDELSNQMIAKIESLIITQKPVLIWGAGTLTQYLLKNTALKDCNIIGLVDSNKNYHGKKIMDIKIIPPSCLIEQKYHGIPIILSTYMHNEQIKAIIQNDLCLLNDIIMLSGEYSEEVFNEKN